MPDSPNRPLPFSWALLVGLLLAMGCDPSRPGPSSILTGPGPRDGVSQTAPVVVGDVLDDLGQPVAEARVRFYRGRDRDGTAPPGDDTPFTATTDAGGHFQIASIPAGVWTGEAVDTRERLAIRRALTVGPSGTSRLGAWVVKPPGRLRGRVVLPDGAPALGIEVFVPGTDAVARTDASGSFTFSRLGEGSYDVVAMAPRRVPALREGLAVRPGETTEGGTWTLPLDVPVIAAASPSVVAPGMRLVVTGRSFGASRSTTFQVRFGEVQATTWNRVSDDRLEVVVPAGGTSPLRLVSEGLESDPWPLSVVNRLTMSPTHGGGTPGEVASWSVDPSDLAVSWTLEGPDGAPSLPDGTTRPDRPGLYRVTARAGELAASAFWSVSPYRLDLAGPIDGTAAPHLAVRPVATRTWWQWKYPAHELTLWQDGSPIWTNPGGGQPLETLPADVPVASASLVAGGAWTADGTAGMAFYWYRDHALWYLSRIEQVRFGRTMQADHLYRVAGNGTATRPPDGSSGLEAGLPDVYDLVRDPDGRLVALYGTGLVYRLEADGTWRWLAGQASVVPSAGVTGWKASSIGGSGVRAVTLGPDGDMAVASLGQIVLCSAHARRRYGLDLVDGGVVTLLSGSTARLAAQPDPGVPGRTTVSYPEGLVFLPDGTLLVSDQGGTVRALAPDGSCRTVAGLPLALGVTRSLRQGASAGPVTMLPRGPMALLGATPVLYDSLSGWLVGLKS